MITPDKAKAAAVLLEAANTNAITGRQCRTLLDKLLGKAGAEDLLTNWDEQVAAAWAAEQEARDEHDEAMRELLAVLAPGYVEPVGHIRADLHFAAIDAARKLVAYAEAMGARVMELEQAADATEPSPVEITLLPLVDVLLRRRMAPTEQLIRQAIAEATHVAGGPLPYSLEAVALGLTLSEHLEYMGDPVGVVERVMLERSAAWALSDGGQGG